MANEAVDCLKEGILNSATDGDIGAVFGLGFPPFLGGPFRWIDHISAPVLVRQLQGFAATYGPQFAPSELLVDMAKKGTKFHKD
jgi:3-hydroxyacyl-CoA dehydrogenase/enoyl-CoA hydratase/3-hydroxybutyryl-CoA epimerase